MEKLTLAEIKSLIAEDPKNAMHYQVLGNCHLRHEEYEEAISSYEKSVKLAPEEPTAYLCLAEIYERLKHYETANEYFERAVDVAPDSKNAVHKLAEWKAWYIKHQ